MQSQDVAPRHSSSSGPVVDVERAEAALVEHYPRLVRLAYLVLPPGLGRQRRVLSAHALVQRTLPRGRSASGVPVHPGGRETDPGYAFVRLQVLRTALEAGRPLRRTVWPKRAQLPPLLPTVWGLRLFPRSGGADELALDQRLASLSGPARAAYVLRGLERLPDPVVHELLTAAGVTDPGAALRQADRVPGHYALLESPEFDPCSLQVRPTDLMRRRQHSRAALAGAAALAVCGTLVALPHGGWGPDGAAAPVYAKNPSAEAALDPARLTKVSPTAWRASARLGFSVWPARGSRTGDTALLRRALAVWARPGESVRVSATPGTPSGGPAGPPQLLYAGDVDNARVVIFYDGLRIARYAEPKGSTAQVALDFARVDGATGAEAAAVVLGRSDGNVRYLTAPWVTEAAGRDLLRPDSEATDLGLKDGVARPLAGPARKTGPCTSWNALQLTDDSGTHLLSDLGELVPARLTTGSPADPQEATDESGRRAWAPFACSLGAVRAQGVRSVNAWQYAGQPLPDDSGTAEWVCTRAETWRGTGPRVLAQFRTPGGKYGTAVARAEDVSACGARDPHVLAGVLWKSEAGTWYLLAAGTEDTASISVTGGVRATSESHLLAVRIRQGASADLTGTLDDGTPIGVLRQR
ncbi:hypothetical protein ACFYNZ_01905 [Streptomyces kebangsaanensis]|uniref:DNA-directed RNA polymerase specialized sigma24 family protein n=1 Tax=Streptomyces kebangsaanensis TaxID=864058 RepID=A0ABW6KLF7_9ACTN